MVKDLLDKMENVDPVVLTVLQDLLDQLVKLDQLAHEVTVACREIQEQQ